MILIFDLTPDVAYKEHLSIFVWIVAYKASTTEHLLAYQGASDTTATVLFEVISNSFKSKNVSLNKLVGHTYDRAFSMSGCYSSLQVIIKEKIW